MLSAVQTKKSTAVILWLITVSYMGLIFYLSSQPIMLPKMLSNTDKVIHAVVYLVLALLFYFSLLKSGLRKSLLAISLLLAVIYGISDEIHQYYVPGRIASIGDAIADSFGALIGSFLAAKLSRQEYFTK
jgi:VanZ family protein